MKEDTILTLYLNFINISNTVGAAVAFTFIILRLSLSHFIYESNPSIIFSTLSVMTLFKYRSRARNVISDAETIRSHIMHSFWSQYSSHQSHKQEHDTEILCHILCKYITASFWNIFPMKVLDRLDLVFDTVIYDWMNWLRYLNR